MNFAEKIRFFVALWLGKSVFILSRIAGKNGTTLPGAWALRIYPNLIGELSGQLVKGVVMVTGTNGKTTTTNMLAAAISKSGVKLTFNQAGANLITGVTTAFINSTGWDGHIQTEMALLEVDEATVIKVAPQVKPKYVLITNFFRDQLDRYGELDKTVFLVKDTISNFLPKAKLVLNADDPLVAQIGVGRKDAIYYGVGANKYSTTANNQSREAKYCSFCGASYVYDLYYYGQLGVYHCSHCGFKRPVPKYLAEDIELQGLDGITFSITGEKFHIQHQGFYNLYNALAAATVALSMDIDVSTVRTALAEFSPQAGRMEQFQCGATKLTLSLVKNPTGLNEVMRAMVQVGKPVNLMLAINDNAADGRDISWLWDVDFEELNGKVEHVVCSGIRAEDMAVRLKYAGIATERLVVIKDLSQAVAQLLDYSGPDQAVYVLPTYTALFPVRDVLNNLRSKVYAT